MISEMKRIQLSSRFLNCVYFKCSMVDIRFIKGCNLLSLLEGEEVRLIYENVVLGE